MTGCKIRIKFDSTAKKTADSTANPKKRKALLDHNVLDDLPEAKKSKPSPRTQHSDHQTQTKFRVKRSQIFGPYEDSEPGEEPVSASVRGCKGHHFSATKEAELQASFQITIKAEGPCPSYEFEMSGHQLAAVAGWQNLSASSGGQKGKDFRKQKKHNDSSSSPNTRQSSTSSTPSYSNAPRPRGYRSTKRHIFFWGSVLSNFNTDVAFPGVFAMSYLVSELEREGIAHPAGDTVATNLLATHLFTCGEQWMMACKAWLFESRTIELAATNVSDIPESFDTIRSRLMQSVPANQQERTLQQSTLLRILKTSDPKTMKNLGRHCTGWNQKVWNRASIPIVVSGTIARAEANLDLGKVYAENGDGSKSFVEGSPYDRIWGVGIDYNDPRIENPQNWKGENRLGRCHDEACRVYCVRRGLRPQKAMADTKSEILTGDEVQTREENKEEQVDPAK